MTFVRLCKPPRFSVPERQALRCAFIQKELGTPPSSASCGFRSALEAWWCLIAHTMLLWNHFIGLSISPECMSNNFKEIPYGYSLSLRILGQNSSEPSKLLVPNNASLLEQRLKHRVFLHRLVFILGIVKYSSRPKHKLKGYFGPGRAHYSRGNTEAGRNVGFMLG